MGFIFEILIVFAAVTGVSGLYQVFVLKRSLGRALHVAAVLGILAMLTYFLIVLGAG